MQNSSVTFTSRIRLVQRQEFDAYIKANRLRAHVDCPWTADEILRAKRAYTTGVCDCSAGGITDVSGVVMFHLCPLDDNLKNWDHVVKTLEKKIRLSGTKLRGLLLGSENYSESNELFGRLQEFMKKYNIPYSKFRLNKKFDGEVDILFNSVNNEWRITNPEIGIGVVLNQSSIRNMSKEGKSDALVNLAKRAFKDVEIDKGDVLDL